LKELKERQLIPTLRMDDCRIPKASSDLSQEKEELLGSQPTRKSEAERIADLSVHEIEAEVCFFFLPQDFLTDP
jgi:hypothetical protein